MKPAVDKVIIATCPKCGKTVGAVCECIASEEKETIGEWVIAGCKVETVDGPIKIEAFCECYLSPPLSARK